MKGIFVLLLAIYVLPSSNGQNTFSSSKNSDPKAKVILDKLKKQYDSYKSMEVKFEMELELPGQPLEVQKGTVIQDGVRYQVKMNDQEIYADGKTIWLYLKKNKEVQITDMDDSGSSDFLSPKQMMSIYDKGDFVYSIIEEKNVNGQKLADIEFKPLNKKTDYTKMRLTVDKKTNKMISLRVFSRDGSRYTLKVSDIIANKKYDPVIFTFNAKTAPGVHIEDLRMD